jgi:hypothetical protein
LAALAIPAPAPIRRRDARRRWLPADNFAESFRRAIVEIAMHQVTENLA